MVDVEIRLSSSKTNATPIRLTMSEEGRWYSIASTKLADLYCEFISPADEVRVAFLQGILFVRCKGEFRCGLDAVHLRLGRNTQATITAFGRRFLSGRDELRRSFMSFAELYRCSEYLSFRRHLIAGSDDLGDFTKPCRFILAEILRQTEANLHRLTFAVGRELSKIHSFVAALYCDFCFEGPLFGFLSDPSVTEVVINGSSEMWIEKEGVWVKSELPFDDWTQFEHWLLFQSSFAAVDLYGEGRFCNFPLRSGARVHVCRSPVARVEGYVSIRRHQNKFWNLEELLQRAFLTEEQFGRLLSAIGSRRNIVVIGPTGSGKTTLLAALASHCHPGERVIVLEDVPELRLCHDHVVYLQSFSDQVGSDECVDLETLVKNSLRMRPDRLVVGECRGNEVFALLQALQTGHKGSLCTLHAESPEHALVRLQTLLQRSQPTISDEVAMKMISLGLDLVVCVSRTSMGERKVVEIQDVAEIIRSLESQAK